MKLNLMLSVGETLITIHRQTNPSDCLKWFSLLLPAIVTLNFESRRVHEQIDNIVFHGRFFLLC